MSEDFIAAKVRKLEVGTIWDWGKITLRHITTIVSILGVLWMFSGPTIKGYAAESFAEMLKEQGVDPEVFKKMQSQAVEVDKDLEQLGKEASDIQKDLTALKGDLRDVSRDIKGAVQAVNKLESTVDKLVTIQMQRAGMTLSPPGDGPTGLPRLGAVQ